MIYRITQTAFNLVVLIDEIVINPLRIKVTTWDQLREEYTLFQNGRHFSILLFGCKLAHLASLSNVKFKRIFYLERGQKGQFSIRQKNTKMAAILE